MPPIDLREEVAIVGTEFIRTKKVFQLKSTTGSLSIPSIDLLPSQTGEQENFISSNREFQPALLEITNLGHITKVLDTSQKEEGKSKKSHSARLSHSVLTHTHFSAIFLQQQILYMFNHRWVSIHVLVQSKAVGGIWMGGGEILADGILKLYLT